MILARVPFSESALGKKFSSFDLFTTRIAQSEAGAYEAVSAIDGVRRIIGYRFVPRPPLVVLVTMTATRCSRGSIARFASSRRSS
jgi:hypothetical protein